MNVKSKLKSLQAKAKAELGFRLLKQQVKPSHDFDPAAFSAPPEYQHLQHWAAHPEKESHALITPAGVAQPFDYKPIDVFYIYPTLCFSKRHWNAPLSHAKTNEAIDQMIMPGQASVYNEQANVYAPRYRQATFYAFLDGSTNSQQAFDLAYHDVELAFDYFLGKLNQGRPFIIASHSQGSLHGIRLLEQRIEGSAVYDQLIAAYLIGMQIPQDKLGRTLHQITAAQAADDTGCIVAYDSYGMSGAPLHDRDQVQQFYPDSGTWEYRRHKAVIGINPLSWTTNTEPADQSLHRGAVRLKMTEDSKFDMRQFFSDDAAGIRIKSLSAPTAGEVSAQLDDNGILHISKPKTAAYQTGLLPNDNYHIHDISLFYMNLRENVKVRIDSFLRLID